MTTTHKFPSLVAGQAGHGHAARAGQPAAEEADRRGPVGRQRHGGSATRVDADLGRFFDGGRAGGYDHRLAIVVVNVHLNK